MSERERSREGPVPEGEERPNEGGDPQDFLRLVREVHGASGEDQQAKVAELIDVLVAMRAPGNERAEAKAVLSQLDLKALTGLVDAQGRNARKEAVETVMSLGFPYALAVPPEDFAFARSENDAEDRAAQVLPRLDATRRWAARLGFAATGLQLAGVVLHGFGDRLDEALMMSTATVASAGWSFFFAARAKEKRRDQLPGAMGLLLATGALSGLFAPLPALGAVAAALLGVASLAVLVVSGTTPRLPKDPLE